MSMTTHGSSDEKLTVSAKGLLAAHVTDDTDISQDDDATVSDRQHDAPQTGNVAVAPPETQLSNAPNSNAQIDAAGLGTIDKVQDSPTSLSQGQDGPVGIHGLLPGIAGFLDQLSTLLGLPALSTRGIGFNNPIIEPTPSPSEIDDLLPAVVDKVVPDPPTPVIPPHVPVKKPTPFDPSDFDGLSGSGAGVSHVIRDPSQIDGVNGFTVVGDVAHGFGRLGSSVASGDFNGDGYSDVVLGAPTADRPVFAEDEDGNTIINGDRGKTIVVFGGQDTSSPTTLVSDIDGANGFSFIGSVNSNSGTAVANAGDFNGDGIDDVLVGGPRGNGAPIRPNTGEGYILFGGSGTFSPITVSENLDAQNGVVLESTSFETRWLGDGKMSAGDFNGDGLDDIAIGASVSRANGDHHAGRAFVVFGTTDGLQNKINLDDLNGTNGFKIVGSGPSANLGHDLVFAGDINGDGLEDLIVGLGPSNATDEVKSLGGTMVLYGRSSGDIDVINPADLDGKNGFMITATGFDWDTSSFNAAAALGDVNGDGYKDFLVNYGTTSYVIYGGQKDHGAQLDVSSMTPDQGFKIEGTATSFYPNRFAGKVDFNADGYDDILLSADRHFQDGEVFPGTAAIIFGGPSREMKDLTLDELPADEGILIKSSVVGDYFGSSISAAGDVNGDGISDIVVGAKGGQLYVDDTQQFPDTFTGTRWDGFEGFVNWVGQASVIYGQAPGEAVIRIGSDGDQTIRGGAFDDGLAGEAGDDRLFGGAGNDRLFGGTGDDVLIGGPGADILGGNQGTDTASYEDAVAGVVASLADPAANTGDAAGDNYIDIANLTGSGLDDMLFGDAHANILEGLSGDDTLTGGRGRDTFSSAPGSGDDTITDFNPGQDNLDLTGFGFASLSQALSLASSNGTNAVFAFGNGDNLTLEDTSVAALNGQNIII